MSDIPELKNFKLIHSLCPIGKDCFAAMGDNGLFYYDAGKDEVQILIYVKINIISPASNILVC